MSFTSKLRVSAVVFVSLIFALPGVSSAEWPEHPVKLIVAYGAGGGTDRLSRLVAEPLSAELGQPVVVENKPGAGGTIGANAAAKADADGYNLYMMANGHAIAGVMYKSLPYDPVNDFAGVSLVAKMPLVVIARPDFPANNLQELVALAKSKPGDLNYASVGVGSTQHFAGTYLSTVTGMDVVHIPYQKTPQGIAALLNGEVDYMVEVMAPALGQIKSGDLKAIAVTSGSRFPGLPDVPTVAESGYADYDVATWYGVATQKDVDPAILEKASAALGKVLSNADLKAKGLTSGYVMGGSSPNAFKSHLASEVKRWGQVRAQAGIAQK